MRSFFLRDLGLRTATQFALRALVGNPVRACFIQPTNPDEDSGSDLKYVFTPWPPQGRKGRNSACLRQNGGELKQKILARGIVNVQLQDFEGVSCGTLLAHDFRRMLLSYRSIPMKRLALCSRKDPPPCSRQVELRRKGVLTPADLTRTELPRSSPGENCGVPGSLLKSTGAQCV